MNRTFNKIDVKEVSKKFSLDFIKPENVFLVMPHEVPESIASDVVYVTLENNYEDYTDLLTSRSFRFHAKNGNHCWNLYKDSPEFKESWVADVVNECRKQFVEELRQWNKHVSSGRALIYSQPSERPLH